MSVVSSISFNANHVHADYLSLDLINMLTIFSFLLKCNNCVYANGLCTRIQCETIRKLIITTNAMKAATELNLVYCIVYIALHVNLRIHK